MTATPATNPRHQPHAAVPPLSFQPVLAALQVHSAQGFDRAIDQGNASLALFFQQVLCMTLQARVDGVMGLDTRTTEVRK